MKNQICPLENSLFRKKLAFIQGSELFSDYDFFLPENFSANQ